MATRMPIGPSLLNRAPVSAVAFDKDGRTARTACFFPFGPPDYRIRSWPLPSPIEGDVRRIALWARQTTGQDPDVSEGPGLVEDSKK
jgi:hypothetical protein